MLGIFSNSLGLNIETYRTLLLSECHRHHRVKHCLRSVFHSHYIRKILVLIHLWVVIIEGPVVTIYTTRFNITIFYNLPTDTVTWFVWILEQTATFALYSSNLLVFITEMVCVYCAVRNGPWCKINFCLKTIISSFDRIIYCYSFAGSVYSNKACAHYWYHAVWCDIAVDVMLSLLDYVQFHEKINGAVELQ
jgi:hypothetical protein